LEEALHRNLESTLFRNRTERDIRVEHLEAVVFHGRIQQIPERWLRSLAAWQRVDWCADYIGGNVRAGAVLVIQTTCNSAFVRPGSALEVRPKAPRTPPLPEETRRGPGAFVPSVTAPTESNLGGGSRSTERRPDRVD
jgi:hypothetical protein